MRFSRSTCAVVLALAAVGAACADDEEGATGSSEPAAGVAEEGGAQRSPATGEPITIGATAPTDSPVFSAPEVLEATAAAVEYMNNELDGIGGRPLELETCTTSSAIGTIVICSFVVASTPGSTWPIARFSFSNTASHVIRSPSISSSTTAPIPAPD